MIKILMNNMGSQANEIIKLLHQEDTYIIYLSKKNNELIKKQADEFYIEENMNNIQEYIKYIINICKNKHIDVFIPSNKMLQIIDYINVFKKNNIKILLPEDIDIFKKLNDKIKTYELLKKYIPEQIPEYYLINNYKDFEKYCKLLKNKNKEICIKYTNDIASNSFRIIKFNEHDISELKIKSDKQKSKISHSINYEDIKNILKNNEFKDIILMEYIDGLDISCDCLKTKNENIIVPRIKINKKEQIIKKDKNIIDICNKILYNINYDTPCDIQFRLDKNNNLYLLEINTRMSGGVMISSWATDINIPLISIKQLLNEKILFNNDWKDVAMMSTISYEKIFI